MFDYTVEVRYGLMAGLDPSRALIFSLQAMGGDLVSREFVMSESLAIIFSETFSRQGFICTNELSIEMPRAIPNKEIRK